MFQRLKKQLAYGVIACCMVVSTSANAAVIPERPSGMAMMADLILARPLLAVGTLVGTGAFIVTAPFSAVGGNFKEAGNALVVTPFKATFVRCLGCSNKHILDKSNTGVE